MCGNIVIGTLQNIVGRKIALYILALPHMVSKSELITHTYRHLSNKFHFLQLNKNNELIWTFALQMTICTFCINKYFLSSMSCFIYFI